MKIVLSTYSLDQPGGSETYVVTLAEHLARLGHEVTVYARLIGPMAKVARDRAVRATAVSEELPDDADAVIAGVDRGLALELVGRYPAAARVFVVHSSQDIHLPPPVPGAVAATVALNDLHLARASACAHAGEVVRLRQPIDLRRFSPRAEPNERPEHVLLLGNYHSGPSERASELRDAWADAELQWTEVGGEKRSFDVTAAIARADIVVGFGRSILEAMACGRPGYVHDQAGSEGWVTTSTYEEMEAGGFAIAGRRLPPDRRGLRNDLDAYRAQWGQEGRDLIRTHHDARDHAAAIVALIERIGPGRPCGERSTLRALEQLAESQLRGEMMAESFRHEAQRLSALYHDSQVQIASELASRRAEREAWEDERAAWASEREHWGAEREVWMHEREEMRRKHAIATDAALRAEQRVAGFRRTRRYRFAQALAWPFEKVRLFLHW